MITICLMAAAAIPVIQIVIEDTRNPYPLKGDEA